MIRLASVGVVIVLWLGLTTTALAEGTLYQLLSSGPTANRINMVILGDGYTAAQESKFESDAAGILSHMLDKSPFGEYSGLLNAYAIYVSSNESGADHPSQGIYRDTYFDGTFEVAGITRLTGISSSGYSKVYALLAEHVPEYDIILMVLNDTQYGGSGGSIAITSIHSAAPEIAMHEMGHSFGSLADEYDTYTPGYSGREDINTTAQTDRALIRWNHWILGSTPIPTPETSGYSSVVGLFEGACYETTGWYRPKLNCEMKSLSMPFCEVCQEQLIKMEYNRLNIIEELYPISSSIEMSENASVDMSVSVLEPGISPLSIQWLVDGDPVDGATAPDFSISGLALGAGYHQVQVAVEDTTSMVLNDPARLLKDAYQWNVTVFASCCGIYTGGLTGNIDCDNDGNRNLADITRLIDHVYISKLALCCESVGNVDGSSDGNVNLADITRLIDHVYISKAETASCQ